MSSTASLRDGNSSQKLEICAVILTILLGSVVFLFNLGHGAFIDYDEAQYAEVIQNTLASGNILTLRSYSNTSWISKPPLYMWSAIAVGEIVSPKELAYRLPSALAGIASIILVMAITYTLTESYALTSIAGLLCLTSPLFVEAARQLRLDVPVTSAILFSALSFLRGLKNEKWYLGIGVGVAIGILTKIVIGLFPFGLLLIWSLVYRNWSWLKSWYFWIGIGLMLLIALPWHVYETIEFGGVFLNDFFFSNVVQRANENILGGTTASSNVLYFKNFFTYGEPWSSLFVLSAPLMFFIRKGNKYLRDYVVFTLFAVCIFVLFLFAGTKLTYYLTPVYPLVAISLVLACGAVSQRLKNNTRLRNGFIACVVLVILVALAYTIYVGFNYATEYKDTVIIANNERDVGMILAANPSPSPVYTYQWSNLDTLRNYANGRAIGAMQLDQPIDESFFLIVPSYMIYSYPPWFRSRLTTLYKGAAITLYKFTY